MRVIWEEKDLHAGRRVCISSVVFIIGYRVNPEVGGPSNFYGLIDTRDGMFHEMGNKASVVETLNEDGYLPEEVVSHD